LIFLSEDSRKFFVRKLIPNPYLLSSLASEQAGSEKREPVEGHPSIRSFHLLPDGATGIDFGKVGRRSIFNQISTHATAPH
jgi:hypothetical protein